MLEIVEGRSEFGGKGEECGVGVDDDISICRCCRLSFSHGGEWDEYGDEATPCGPFGVE